MEDIQKEIDRVSKAGGGTILLPAGEYHFKKLKSKVNLVGVEDKPNEKKP
ncbi:hypothetical protein LCGC14_0615360 [marine sediment metagenome]|uniref:Pectate lyase superfamily protein domain-containing protein n=1 Tax=marine sediment metagenome TaxID=412755 RepID=A0A0F9TST3_9ZZZZ